jgi:hypothetical protein
MEKVSTTRGFNFHMSVGGQGRTNVVQAFTVMDW